jgi:tetratricopeptide (TPR) repeat protein
MKLEQNLRVSPLPAEAQHFLRARLYAYHGRPEQAIQELETLAAQSRSSSLTQALGDLYLQTGALDKATTNYLLARQMANASADLTGQAGAYLGLGHVAKARGQTKMAQAYWQSAADLYHKAGDNRLAAQVIILLRPIPTLSDMLAWARLVLWPVLILLLCGLAISLGFYWWQRRLRPL